MSDGKIKLLIDLAYWLKERGWVFVGDTEYYPGRLEIRIKPAPESPPDLSVHITDGMGSQDRVGG